MKHYLISILFLRLICACIITKKNFGNYISKKLIYEYDIYLAYIICVFFPYFSGPKMQRDQLNGAHERKLAKQKGLNVS